MQATYDVHYENLMKLLRSVREEFAVPELPFIAGDFVPSWRDACIDICKPVVTAIRDVCRDCGYGYFVESDGLLTNFEELHRATPCGNDMIEDPIHFSGKSHYVLGKRYFEAFLKIKENN